MAISINSNFQLLSKLHLDSRKSFDTLADMASFLEGAIPEGFITYCVETDKYYKFNALNDVDATTGKWREFSSGGGDIIDDSLETSTTKTYSIDKIKELMSTQGGVIPVDVLPDLTNEEERKNIKLNKIYLVPNDGEDTNVKDEYVCIHTEGTQDVYREALVGELDYDTYKAEIEDYVKNGGTLNDDFATYILTKTTTAMTEQTYAEMIESINNADADFTAYETRVTSEVITPATEEKWTWEKIGSRDGGSVEWGEDIIVNNPSGKVTKGTNLNGKNVLDIVAKMLTVDEPTTISLTLNPTNVNTLFEKNVASIADVGLTAKITLGTGTIAKGTNIIFKKDGVAISTQPYVNGTYTYTYDEVGANVTDNTTKYSVEVEYSMNETTNVAKAEQKYTFVLPIFYGSSATKDVADPTALTKVLSEDKSQKLSYTVTNGFCVIAIPDTLNITKVLDQNGFDNTADFSYVTQAVTLGTATVVYKVYTNAMAVTCTNFSYQFTLA